MGKQGKNWDLLAAIMCFVRPKPSILWCQISKIFNP